MGLLEQIFIYDPVLFWGKRGRDWEYPWFYKPENPKVKYIFGRKEQGY